MVVVLGSKGEGRGIVLGEPQPSEAGECWRRRARRGMGHVGPRPVSISGQGWALFGSMPRHEED